MDISVLPSPLRRFLAQLDEVRSVSVLDMDQVGRVLVELAADEEYLGPLIAEMPPEGVMAYTPPGDIHNPGHVLGTGPSPYSLILLGDDMYLFDREEYDPGQETWRKLAPGDPGQSHR